jgi:hypothetical protein
VTSSWLEEKHRPNIQLHEVPADENRTYATQDILDIYAARIFIFFTDPTGTLVRAGRHVEFGIAVARNIPIFVVGREKENIFHHLSTVTHFDTWEQVKQLLTAMA